MHIGFIITADVEIENNKFVHCYYNWSYITKQYEWSILRACVFPDYEEAKATFEMNPPMEGIAYKNLKYNEV